LLEGTRKEKPQRERASERETIRGRDGGRHSVERREWEGRGESEGQGCKGESGSEAGRENLPEIPSAIRSTVAR
jgi:hypothetical protein